MMGTCAAGANGPLTASWACEAFQASSACLAFRGRRHPDHRHHHLVRHRHPSLDLHRLRRHRPAVAALPEDSQAEGSRAAERRWTAARSAEDLPSAEHSAEDLPSAAHSVEDLPSAEHSVARYSAERRWAERHVRHYLQLLRDRWIAPTAAPDSAVFQHRVERAKMHRARPRWKRQLRQRQHQELESPHSGRTRRRLRKECSSPNSSIARLDTRPAVHSGPDERVRCHSPTASSRTP
jgi:hypothetical protein